MSIKDLTVTAFLLLSSLAGSVLAQEKPLTFTSGPVPGNLLELYTSEGCSSCPPADDWMRTLKYDRRLWKEIIPVSLHVDYWNSLGWKDKFAAAEFSRRQRHYAAIGQARSVYTPGFFFNGKEWSGYFDRAGLPATRRPSPGDLTITIREGMTEVRFSPVTAAGHYDIHLAVLGFNVKNVINNGENSGKVLRHDFVTVAYSKQPLTKDGNNYDLKTSLPEHNYHAYPLGLAAWVSTQDNPTPIQAVGGWLSPPHAD